MKRLFPPNEPSHTDPSHTDPSHTDPSHTDPSHTEPSQTDLADSIEVDPRVEIPNEARSRDDRPWIYTNMITSADGGTAVDGVSGGLGTDSDKAVFGALRSIADVILVGAGTVRAESYRSPGSRPDALRAREERGQLPYPRLAIVSRQLTLPPDLPLFDNDANRPLIFTCSTAPKENRELLESRAEVVVVGEATVDLAAAVDHLGSIGANTVLCEGGPSLNGQLIAADLVDEWNLSISPLLLGADSARAAVGKAASGPPAGMQLQRVWVGDDVLFCRWVRK